MVGETGKLSRKVPRDAAPLFQNDAADGMEPATACHTVGHEEREVPSSGAKLGGDQEYGFCLSDLGVGLHPKGAPRLVKVHRCS
jgi:hypothetical protein